MDAKILSFLVFLVCTATSNCSVAQNPALEQVHEGGEIDTTTFSCSFTPLCSVYRPNGPIGPPLIYFEERLAKALRQLRMQSDRFDINRTNLTEYAQVRSERGRKIFDYNPSGFVNFDTKCGSSWATTALILHELGHIRLSHLDQDTRKRTSTRDREIEADEQIGLEMRNLTIGLPQLSLNDALAVINCIGIDCESGGYPKKQERLDAVTRGWYNADNRYLSMLLFLKANSKPSKRLQEKMLNGASQVGDYGSILDIRPNAYSILAVAKIISETKSLTNKALAAWDKNITVQTLKKWNSEFETAVTFVPQNSIKPDYDFGNQPVLSLIALYVNNDSTLSSRQFDIKKSPFGGIADISWTGDFSKQPYRYYDNLIKRVPIGSNNTEADLSGISQSAASIFLDITNPSGYILLNNHPGQKVTFSKKGELVIEDGIKLRVIGKICLSNKPEFTYMVYDKYFVFWYIDEKGNISTEEGENIGSVPANCMAALKFLW